MLIYQAFSCNYQQVTTIEEHGDAFMTVQKQIETCSEQYKRWKEMALGADSVSEVKRCLEKAMFWMELQTAFVALWSVETSNGSDPGVKHKLMLAKSNLSRKLADYAEKTLKEIDDLEGNGGI
jgi:hypothetical protein